MLGVGGKMVASSGIPVTQSEAYTATTQAISTAQSNFVGIIPGRSPVPNFMVIEQIVFF